MKIKYVNTDATKGVLPVGTLGYDAYVAGGDEGRVGVGTASGNVLLAKKSEVDAILAGQLDSRYYTETEVDTNISTEITNRAQIGKNAIINGDFSVQQYPTDIDTAPVAMVASTYQIDRFWSYVTGVTATIQRMPKSLLNGKYVHSVKCVATSTNSSAGMYLRQKIEIFYNGESKTFGAWVKSNNTNARIILTDGVVTTTDAHSGSGLWEFLSFPKIIDINANNLTAYVGIQRSDTTPNIAISSGDYIESTMWQLENGTVASPFEQTHPATELIKCQRYYERIIDQRVIITCYNASYVQIQAIPYKVTKRASPSFYNHSLTSVFGASGTQGAFYSGATDTKNAYAPVYSWTSGTVGTSFTGQISVEISAEL